MNLSKREEKKSFLRPTQDFFNKLNYCCKTLKTYSKIMRVLVSCCMLSPSKLQANPFTLFYRQAHTHQIPAPLLCWVSQCQPH